MIVAVGLAAGGLMVGPLAHSAITRWDQSRIVAFATHRRASMSTMSLDISKAADAPGIIAIGLVIAAVLALRLRWRLVAVTAFILAFELATFLAINEVVRRRRPDVQHLGSVPSTGSFPSGHVEATVVVFGFVALLLAHRSRIAAAVAWLWTGVAAAAVGWSRMYRGMHFPSDVLAGALVGVAILVVFSPLIQRADVSSSRPRNRPPAGKEHP